MEEPRKCPIKINLDPLKGPIDTPEEVAEKWEAIKQWYKDHPEMESPWTKWTTSLPNVRFHDPLPRYHSYISQGCSKLRMALDRMSKTPRTKQEDLAELKDIYDRLQKLSDKIVKENEEEWIFK